MRHLGGRMGYFNPNVDSTFLLSGPGYFAHWARYYLFSRRSLVVAWILGSVRVALGLLAVGTREETERALGLGAGHGHRDAEGGVGRRVHRGSTAPTARADRRCSSGRRPLATRIALELQRISRARVTETQLTP